MRMTMRFIILTSDKICEVDLSINARGSVLLANFCPSVHKYERQL